MDKHNNSDAFQSSVLRGSYVVDGADEKFYYRRVKESV